jgi:hypothetical protein
MTLLLGGKIMGRCAALLTGAIALLPVVVAALAFFAAERGGSLSGTWDRLASAPFLATLIPSMSFALLIGCSTAVLALILNPALVHSAGSSGFRLWALSIGVFLPPVLLVLMGAQLLTTFPGVQPEVLIGAHVVAAYPFIALTLAIAFEGILKAIAAVGLMRKLGFGFRVSLTLRVARRPLAALAMIGAGAAFQNYLLNLDLRTNPTGDALVAMNALFPYTGVPWDVAMLAALVIWATYAGLSAFAVSALRFK